MKRRMAIFSVIYLIDMRRTAAIFVILLLPGMAFAAPAAEPQTLELSAKARVEGADVPLGVVVSTDNADVVLSAAKKDGATPVTFTLYVTPKPKPAPVAPSANAAAAVESSAKIQEGIAGFSPAVAGAMAPVFNLVDGGRKTVSDAIDTQIENTKGRLGTSVASAGEILGSDAVKNAPQNPLGTVWFILQTLYLYLLTILNFIIGSAGIFYPLAAFLILYVIWKLVARARRPTY